MSEVKKIHRQYEKISVDRFFDEVNSEEAARKFLWLRRFGSHGFECPKCKSIEHWEHRHNPEIRECRDCSHQVRLRAGTIFQNSKIPLLTWVRALYFVMQDKRGVSALALKRLLGMKSYGTTWLMLLKIRSALSQRDEGYKLQGIIELDGAVFGKKDSGNQSTVFIGIEQKPWVDERGKKKERAGFAHVFVSPSGQETKNAARQFIKSRVLPASHLKTDGKQMYKQFEAESGGAITVRSKTISGVGHLIDAQLPWVHKFISNSKRWMLGTHHGMKRTNKYLGYYLCEYSYRFNRRHDPNSLLDRAVHACLLANPRSQPMLCG